MNKYNGILSINVNILSFFINEDKDIILEVYSQSKIKEKQYYTLKLNKNECKINKKLETFNFKGTVFEKDSWIFIEKAKITTSLINEKIFIEMELPNRIINNDNNNKIKKQEFSSFCIVNNFNKTKKGIVIYLNSNNINVNLFIPYFSEEKKKIISNITYKDFKIDTFEVNNEIINVKKIINIESLYFSHFKIREFKYLNKIKKIIEINIYYNNEKNTRIDFIN